MKRLLLVLLLIIPLLNGCSIQKFAMTKVANILSASGDGTTFTGEEDPQLLKDALPFTMKLYELMLEQNPEHEELLLATGKLFIMYGHVFVKGEAEIMPDSMIDEKQETLKRARSLYLRGQQYIMKALDLRYEGFSKMLESGKVEEALAMTDEDDLEYLYWCGQGWMGAFSATGFDMKLMMVPTMAIPMLEKVLETDPEYDKGGIQDFFVTWYGAAPEMIGGNEAKAREHLQRSIEISSNSKAGPYVSLASSVCIRKQDIAEFRELLNKALEIDVNKRLDLRLVNILAQDKARWLLKHESDFFLIEE